LTRNAPQSAFHCWKKVAGHVAGLHLWVVSCDARIVTFYALSCVAADFFWAFTLAQRLRCASAIACRALALSLRRGLGSGIARADAFFDGLRVVPLPALPRRARACRNRAIFSSRAFNMWSVKGVSFQHRGRGPLHAKNNRLGGAVFTWELWQTASRWGRSCLSASAPRPPFCMPVQ
jgi:hypothetical protein